MTPIICLVTTVLRLSFALRLSPIWFTGDRSDHIWTRGWSLAENPRMLAMVTTLKVTKTIIYKIFTKWASCRTGEDFKLTYNRLLRSLRHLWQLKSFVSNQSTRHFSSQVTICWCVWFVATSSNPKAPILFLNLHRVPPNVPSLWGRSWQWDCSQKNQLVLVCACCCCPQVAEKSKMLVYASPHFHLQSLFPSVSKSTTASMSIFPQCFWGHRLKLKLLDVFSAPLRLVSTEFLH